LQHEGHWNDASLYSERIREQLRSEVMTRKEANRVPAPALLIEAWPTLSKEVQQQIMLLVGGQAPMALG